MAPGPWAALLAALLAVPAALGLPRDPDRTLDRVRDAGELPVAVTAPLTPAEAAALDRLAADLGARLAAVGMPLHEAVAQLTAREGDGLWIVAVAGGIPEGAELAREAAATRPVGRERFLILVPPGENAFLLAANAAAAGAAEAPR